MTNFTGSIKIILDGQDVISNFNDNLTNAGEDHTLKPSQNKCDDNNSDLYKKKPKFFNGEKVIPIADLDPNLKRWAILARVTQKSQIRTYNNNKNSNGKIFSLTFVDNTGEISATVHNEQCDNFYNKLEFNHVYYIFGGNFKMLHTKFYDNDFELVFTKNTIIDLSIK